MEIVLTPVIGHPPTIILGEYTGNDDGTGITQKITLNITPKVVYIVEAGLDKRRYFVATEKWQLYEYVDNGAAFVIYTDGTEVEITRDGFIVKDQANIGGYAYYYYVLY